jgi:hypothetical protein
MNEVLDDGGETPFLAEGKENAKLGIEDDEEINFGAYQTKPIADYFPYTTVMFADISGFTAWSSTREPFQVFQLLETLYGAFDDIAERRGVFKVETTHLSWRVLPGIAQRRRTRLHASLRSSLDPTLLTWPFAQDFTVDQ